MPDAVAALQVGILLAESGADDIEDAHVVTCAKRHRDANVASDPDELARLDPAAKLIVV